MASKMIQSNWLNELSSKRAELFVNLLNELNYMRETGENVEIDIAEINKLVKSNDYVKMKDHLADINFVETIKDAINKIPESNGSNYFNKIAVRIGMVADEFLYNSFRDVAEFYYINPDNYKVLDIDVFIIATAWRGIDNKWRRLGNIKQTEVREKLYDIINFYRDKGVKIVFYSKEDPTNYDNFIDIAKKCDYIFTTAVEKIEDYKSECENDKVYLLEFGVNPIYNNPIGITTKDNKNNGAIFAGSWYEKYPHRQEDTRTIFDGVLNAEGRLKIIDRNFERNDPKHLFPYNYIRYVSPGIEHETLQKVFKLYTWAINLNSIQTSETMFANRVYELQAMGNLILSNYSIGINNLFPNIFIVQNSEEVKYIMQNLSAKEQYMLQMFGVRKVLKEHTTYHRIEYLLNKIGFDNQYIPDRKVAIVVDDVNNKQNIENFKRQTIKNKTLISTMKLIEEYDTFDYVAFFNNKYEYGEFYLEDLINGFKYTNSSCITKDAYYDGACYVEGIEHSYVNKIKDKYKSVFTTEKFNPKDLVENDSFSAVSGYSIDSLEININSQKIVQSTNNYKLSIIIPVYNNGDHLYGKCFSSLLRSTMFNEMDIVLVDDGSTDDLTIKMVDRLERLYSNVQVYKYSDGGSGSASRPRNKGVYLAKTDFITYLDPDNEAINDGYYHLFNEMMNDDQLDLVVGNMVKYDSREIKLNYSSHVRRINASGIVTNTFELLKETNLRAQSIQALIVKKEIIINNNIQMVENAAGQDTLFFQELLLKCSKIKAIDLDIHIYYGAVSNSVTNTINSSFFKKYLEISKIRFDFLKKNNLLHHYMENRFSEYFIKWFLIRVQRVPESEVSESLEILYEIYNIYEPELHDKDEPLIMFENCMKERNYIVFLNYCKEYFNPIS